MKKIEVLPNGRKRVYTENNKPSKTDQQYKDQVEVNYILRKYQKTGILSHVQQMQGQYTDVSQIPDLHEALLKVELAEKSFMQLPSEVRKMMNNDPTQLIEFLQNPANDEKAIELGLKASPPKADKGSEPKKGEPDVAKKDPQPDPNAN